mmetsp:Transcript_4234/g.10185  ORF Transcript_4234/g.10185 Transcript_4234/m.10185 type:complete len:288 (+) Transcript_4234:2321-3184(+)
MRRRPPMAAFMAMCLPCTVMASAKVPTMYVSPVEPSTAMSVTLTSAASSSALKWMPHTKSCAPYWNPRFCSEMHEIAFVLLSSHPVMSAFMRTAKGDSRGPGAASTVTARSPEPWVSVGNPDSPAGVMQISFSCSLGPPATAEGHGLQDPPQLLPVSSASMHERMITGAPAACGTARVPFWPRMTVAEKTPVASTVVDSTLTISWSILMKAAKIVLPDCSPEREIEEPMALDVMSIAVGKKRVDVANAPPSTAAASSVRRGMSSTVTPVLWGSACVPIWARATVMRS